MLKLIQVSQIDGIIKIRVSTENFCELAQYMTINFGYNWLDLFWQDEELEEEGVMSYESKPTSLVSKLELLNF